ncbi:penicillin acylase family protein [Methylomicrobium sp. RS1]|uniref:penicillin acylase family protein n=1 Tax=Candidatus Methylomicrobium oryzae TaxID=2802053 RepID=UPI001922FD02|nr:penicillin acylase family protein [Methylomicrobium sp. RS1]MBL1265176.1 penicillin acylase family protein [Methylomicrobium sp. RS1]
MKFTESFGKPVNLLKSRPFLGWLAGMLAILAGLWLESIAAHDEAFELAGLDQTVEVFRDGFDVPHVYAQSADDAYFALGYLHARERLWQMELSRRTGSGRLAELFGADVLEQDRFMRTLGLRRAAEANWAQLDSATQASLQAYAKGVNAGIAQSRWLPVEFYLTGAPRPEPWQPVDSLVWLKTMAWRLSGNWWEELLNLRLKSRLPAVQLADLFLPYPGDAPQTLPDVSKWYTPAAAQADRLLVQHRDEADKSVGSNNWVVDGSRSVSGKPLLANDPHLPLTAPSTWYFAHLHAPGLNVIGAGLPGVPGILLGRNEQVAWAFTNTNPDSQDVFVERLVSGSPTHYQTPDGEAAFSEFTEILRIKGAPDELLMVQTSRHGPLISTADADARQATPPGTALALSWVGLRADDMTVRFMLNAGRAQNAEQLKAAARDFHSPQQNIVYADAEGCIGFIAAGRVPLRAQGNELRGTLPAPGWLAQYDWQGTIPFEQLPQQNAGSDGKIVTANQKITPKNYSHFITSGWALPYRAERISHLLDRRARHDVRSFAAVQNDVFNPVAAELLPLLLTIDAENDLSRQILRSMRAWDYRMAADAAQPLVFAAWLRHLNGILLQDKLGELYELVGDYNPAFLVRVLNNRDGSAGRWCRGGASAPTPCAGEIRQALQDAIVEVSRYYGDEPAQWRWGRAHVSVFANQPLGRLPGLGWLFNVETESAGGMDVVNVSGYRYDEQTGRYQGESGPAFRAIYDLAEPDNSVFILGTGQSGRPWSPHYRDMALPWAKGDYLPLTTRRDNIERNAVAHQSLLPE